MFRAVLLLVLFGAISCAPAAEPETLSFADADARLRRVFALAREANDNSVVDRVLEVRDAVQRSFTRKDLSAAEFLIRDAEELVGLDRGGKTMLGLPVAHIDASLRKKLNSIDERLVQGLHSMDADAVTSALKDMATALGDQAGVPDIRQKGVTAKATPAAPAEVTDLFLKALQADPRAYKSLLAGVPGPETMPRAYAYVVQGCMLIRPLVEKNDKERLAIVDDLVRGCCKAMLTLQLEQGFFRLPDVRGKYILLGESIDKLVESDTAALKDGWLVSAFPDGSTSVDAAECGIALLEAGRVYAHANWKSAGQRAADWALKAPLSRNFHYNAELVSLLCAAQRITGAQKYLDSAWSKYIIGVAPGQARNGRWIDPYQARTVHHFTIVRSLQDLIQALPAGKDRDRVKLSCQMAVRSIVTEAESLGAPTTANTVQELSRYLRLFPDAAPAVRAILEQAASSTVQKCRVGSKVRAAVPLPELAAAANVWTK